MPSFSADAALSNTISDRDILRSHSDSAAIGGLQNNAVVPGFDIRVGDDDVATGIGVDAIGIDGVEIIDQIDLADLHPVAILGMDRPARSLANGDVLDPNVARIPDLNVRTGTRTRLQILIEECIALTVNDAPTFDGNIVDIVGIDEMMPAIDLEIGVIGTSQ